MLRNGNAAGGINFLLSFSDFEPFWGNNLRDIIINHAKTKHLPQLKSHLLSIIETNKGLHPQVKTGVFLLAGYLQLTGVGSHLLDLWQEDKHPGVFIYYLWSMINCANEDELSLLCNCFDHFQSLPAKDTEEEKFGKESRNKIAYWFSKSKWLLKDEQVILLDSLYDQYPHLISSFFGKVDHPAAMKRVVFSLGNRSKGESNTDHFILHPQERWDYKKNKYRLSAASMGFLQSTWQNKQNVAGVRSLAYRIWSGNELIAKVIELSREIEIGDDPLYEKAVIKRVELKDQTAVSAFFPLIRKRRHYMDMLKYIWNDECKRFYNAFVLEMADRFGDEEFSFDYMQFLTDLPLPEAEDVLKTNWNIIKSDGFAVQSALYVATPDMLSLVAECIKGHPDPKELFKYIDFTYHFIDANNYKISFGQIVALEPYLQHMDEHTLRWISEYCLKAGHKEWAIDKVYRYLNANDKSYLAPSIKDLVIEMQGFKNGDPRFQAGNLIDNFKRRDVKKQKALQVFEQFSLEDKSLEAIKLLACCLAITGNRNDIKILENYDEVELPGVDKKELYETVWYAIRKRTAF